MWFFNSPRIVFGEEALSWLAQIEGQRAFLVCDATGEKLGYGAAVRRYLEQAGLDVHVYSSVKPDPSTEQVHEIAAQMMSCRPDWVVGLGGGSCLDAARAAWFLYERPDVALEAINPFEHFGLRSKARLATISTTSGTGSDVSWGFSIADHATQTKVVRVSHELIPDLAIVDPCLAQSMPPALTAETGMDALTHAVEAYTNAFAHDFSDALALHAIRLVFEYLSRAVENGRDQEAREKMHNAATLAGLAFSNTAITLAHALAHAVGGVFRTPHARTVGIFLPYTVQFNANLGLGRFAGIAAALGLDCTGEIEPGPALAGAIFQLLEKVGLPGRLAELGLDKITFEKALPDLVARSMASPEIVASLRVPSEDETRRLLEYAYAGRDIDF